MARVSSGDVDIYLSRSWAAKPYLDPVTKIVVSYLESSAHAGNIDESIFVSSAKITELCTGDPYCYFILGLYGSKANTLAPAVAPAGGSPTASPPPTTQIPTLSPTVLHSEAPLRLTEAASTRSQSRKGASSYSSFSLLYSTIDSITDLEDDLPAVGRCSPTTGRYYRYVIRQPDTVSQSISCHIISRRIMSSCCTIFEYSVVHHVVPHRSSPCSCCDFFTPL